MIFDSLKFAWRGLPLTLASSQSFEKASAELKQYSLFKAFKKDSPRIVVSLHNNTLKASKLRNPLTAFGRPVFHGRLIEADASILLTGKFSFATWMQAKFWLLQIACAFGFGLGIYRIGKAIMNSQPLIDMVAWAFPACIGILLWIVTAMVANYQMRRYRDDIEEISNFFRTTLEA